ncbi:MAG: LamG domain-containing protein [Candidatus Synoicihabitans palmerolidicus]|nr:LamG domain-containing protein [Candidatus Synoicihabitans palmerolidicus]
MPTLLNLTRTLRGLFTSLIASAALLPAVLHAQAEFAGRYIGFLNTSVNAAGFALESGFGVYIADVDAEGNIDLNGSLTGTVDASGNVTFTSGCQFAAMGITSATISAGTLSSEYGSTVGNGTTRYKINASTGFTAANGSSGGGGGNETTGDLLTYSSFDNPANPFNDDSGRGVTLAPVNGTPSLTDGALETNGVRLRALINSSFSSEAVSISYFVKVTGAGNWGPRMVAVQKPGTSSHYYGTYLQGHTTSPRNFASYHESTDRSRIYAAPDSALLTSSASVDWSHIVMTHDGSTVRLYLNGVEVLNQTNSGALRPFTSSMLVLAGSDNGLDLFQGALDEVRIFNRALTAAEVTTLAGGGSVGTAVNVAGATTPITYDDRRPNPPRRLPQ